MHKCSIRAPQLDPGTCDAQRKGLGQDEQPNKLQGLQRLRARGAFLKNKSHEVAMKTGSAAKPGDMDSSTHWVLHGSRTWRLLMFRTANRACVLLMRRQGATNETLFLLKQGFVRVARQSSVVHRLQARRDGPWPAFKNAGKGSGERAVAADVRICEAGGGGELRTCKSSSDGALVAAGGRPLWGGGAPRADAGAQRRGERRCDGWP
eukprot:6188662-Pleurochrysis_carterae.AAC.3